MTFIVFMETSLKKNSGALKLLSDSEIVGNFKREQSRRNLGYCMRGQLKVAETETTCSGQKLLEGECIIFH